MDRWREMKRWQRWTLIGVGVLILLSVIGSLAAPEEDETISASDSQTTVTVPETTTIPVTVPTTVGTTVTTRAPAATTTTAAPTTVAGVNYPGRQRDDRVAPASGAIELSGFTTTVANVAKSTDALSRRLICGDVTIRNRDSRSQRYSMFDFRLQTPGGDVRDATIATGQTLDSGDLIPGGSKTGKVCWEDPQQPGQHIVIWKPDLFNADRGIWLVTL